ncbi:transketolase [Alteribacillus persepolensis]|uniref:Transketolase n=1 Tax=Alteribacillus persepolensis TaxID=568899 RepID=A0A1G7YYS7_9BACI|nr:transketolase [Alteribacillus persepolensis]SDH01010.1 transketolase [Alteribacillus persepolensis]
MTAKNNVEELAINTIRTLSIDSIEKANSGHPGLPMGAAPMAFALWTKFMKHNPDNPKWFDRDRFVLSAGHGSMLLYSLLHLSGYELSMDELKQFRQWGSKTPGHPEYGETPGVEATTGPLGQGLAMATGMAMAESHLAAVYNKDDLQVIDHYTYVLCGDGDLMEGVSAESASLAGHLQLSKLIVLYDSNDISLDGDLHQSFSEDVRKRYEAYGWETILVEDGNDIEAIEQAIKQARNSSRPSLIEVKTEIGYGSPNKAGTNAAHGAPLGKDEVTLAKETYKWDFEQEFHVPSEVSEFFAERKAEGKHREEQWNEQLKAYKEKYPELFDQLSRAMNGELPADYDKELPVYSDEKLATRAASGEVLQQLSKAVPSLFGGSADLASSNKTLIKEETDFSRDNYQGRNIWFGVREFAMAACGNGLKLHGGVHPYVSTFLVFSDYLRPALRLSALMELPVTYVFTHDSIAVGEDGPTHEPIEQTTSLRAIPNVNVIRPADGNETTEAWKAALESEHAPTALVLTRQGLPTLPGTKEKAKEGMEKGAYVLSSADKTPDLLLLATGSEVALALDTKEALEKEGIYANVVSMPNWKAFDEQDEEYKKQVLPDGVPALAMEMGASHGWYKYVGAHGAVLGIDQFGASAPGNEIIEKYGFTVENAVAKAKALLNR